jgi:hypothetical protein
MTAYRAGSSIGVPPSDTISAVMPCSRPRVLTRSMKAGGKLNSRPQSSPIFIRLLFDGSPAVLPTATSSPRLGYYSLVEMRQPCKLGLA